MCYILYSYHKMTSWILLLRKKGVKKNKEVHETAPSEGPFCQAHNLELLYFCLIAAAAVLGNKKRKMLASAQSLYSWSNIYCKRLRPSRDPFLSDAIS